MMRLFSKNSNLCGHNSPTLQTDRQTDGQTDRQTTCDRNTALCTKVHRAVKTKTQTNLGWPLPNVITKHPDDPVMVYHQLHGPSKIWGRHPVIDDNARSMTVSYDLTLSLPQSVRVMTLSLFTTLSLLLRPMTLA